MQAERVGLQRLAQRLLEGLLLELQHQPVGLLPLGFPLLGRLPPGGGGRHGRKGRPKLRKCKTSLAIWTEFKFIMQEYLHAEYKMTK